MNDNYLAIIAWDAEIQEWVSRRYRRYPALNTWDEAQAAVRMMEVVREYNAADDTSRWYSTHLYPSTSEEAIHEHVAWLNDRVSKKRSGESLHTRLSTLCEYLEEIRDDFAA